MCVRNSVHGHGALHDMARFLYRLLRVANIVGNFEESALREAMTNSAVKSRIQGMVKDELSKPLSHVLPLTGVAMHPTLNSSVSSPTGVHDRLVIRRMSGKTQTFLNRVYVDDVVVVRDPDDARRKYVRRVAGLPGDELVSSSQGDNNNDNNESMRIPGDHCWVVRDNDAAKDSPDSRKFGPLELDHVLGRVMYAIRSATDHGRVVSSPLAMASDAIVLAHEPIAVHLKDSPPGNNKDNSDGDKQ